MKICPVGAEPSGADGQTYTTKLLVAFSNFAIAPKNYNHTYHCTYTRTYRYIHIFTRIRRIEGICGMWCTKYRKLHKL
jgi:hypothetical protein